MIDSPIRWIGGKARQRQKLVPLLQAAPHTLYVEVFGGAGWVLFAKPPTAAEVYNDLDGELVNFFRVIQDQPEAFLDSCKWLLASREWFNEMAATDSAMLDPVRRARRFYYLLMGGFCGQYDPPRLGLRISNAQRGRRMVSPLNYHLQSLHKRVRLAHQRLLRVFIEHDDWRNILDRYDDRETLFYLDPPYPGNECDYRHNMTGWAEHEELATRLSGLQGRWLLTLYDQPRVRELYTNYWQQPMVTTGGAPAPNGSRIILHELVIANYDPYDVTMLPLLSWTTSNQPMAGERIR